MSVCIPSYNAQAYVLEAIASVREQDYSDIELIIVDDNSKDNTCSVIEEAISDFPFPVIFERNSKNLGLAGNWNKSVSLSSGQYIKILPCDDRISENCISRQVEALENSANAVFAFVPRGIIDAGGNQKFGLNFFKEGLHRPGKLRLLCILMGTNPIGEPGAVLFRSDAAKKIGDFDGSLPYVIDVDYWERLLEFGDAYKVSGAVAFFRISNNLSVTLGRDRLKNYQAFIERIGKKHGFSRLIISIGKCQAFINDILRRVVHARVFNSRDSL